MDDFEKQRDESLIEEREKYEQQYFAHIVDDMMKSDNLDKLIAQRLEYIDSHFEFEPTPAYEMLEEIYYDELDAKFEELRSDVIDYIDYPEGYDDNGERHYIELYEPDWDDFEPDYIDLQIENELAEYERLNQNDYDPAEIYEQLVEDAFIDYHDSEEKHLEELIKEHVKEEKLYLDDIVMEIIADELYFERAIDELIFDRIDMDYEPDFFDYESDEYWYDPHFDRPDESAVDSFDSLGDIDYPEGEVRFEYQIPVEFDCDDEMERDFRKYQRNKEVLFGFKDEDISEPEGELILEPPHDIEEELIKNKEKIQEVFKDYVTKDDTLDRLIKEKLREMKFDK